MIISLIFFIFISTILINQIKISIKYKLLTNVIFFIIYSYLYFDNLKNLALSVTVYFNFLYIFINFYTTKISSIRIRILESIKFNQPILTEQLLYNDRSLRIKKIKDGLELNLLLIFLQIILFFRKLYKYNEN